MASVPGFTRPTLTELENQVRTDINARLPGSESRLRRSVLNVLSSVLAGAAHLLYGFISFIAKNVIIDTAQTEWLDRWASIWGIQRKAASFASGTVLASGSNGLVIPTGTQFQRADGAAFESDADATISGGTASVSLSAIVAGHAGNTDTGTKINLVAQIPGIQTETTVEAPGLSGGVDQETDSELRNRLLLRIQETPHGGIETDYEQWALEVSGVTRAWVYPNELGMGTVSVRFVMDNKSGTILPDSGEVATVQAHLDLKRPVTATVTSVAPTLQALDLTIHIEPDTAAIRAAVQAELQDLLLRDGKPGATIYLSRIREAISLATGEFQHALTSPSANVTHTAGQMPSLGTIAWN